MPSEMLSSFSPNFAPAGQVPPDFYQALLENGLDTVVILNPNGSLRWASSAFEKRLGYRVTDWVGRAATELLHPDDLAAALQAATESAATGETVTVNVRVRMRSGGWRTFEARLRNRLADPIIGGVVINATDLTDRLHLEQEKSRLDAKLATVFRTSPDAIAIADLATGRFTDVSAGFTQLFGYSAAEALGRTALELGLWPQPEQRAALVQKVAEAGEAQNVEVVMRAKSGRTFTVLMSAKHLELDGRPHFLAAARDISDRKRAEDALRESQALWLTAFQTSPDAIGYSRLSDGCYLAVNSGFTEMLGYSEAETLGKTSVELGVWADPADRGRFAQQIREHGQVNNARVTLKAKDGRLIAALVSARPITLNSETCILTTARDITALQATEERLRQSEERYRLVSELVSDYAFSVVFEPGGAFRVEWVTEAFTRLTGHPVSELETLAGWQRIVHPADLPILVEQVTRLRSGQSVSFEMRVFRRDGTLIWLTNYGRPTFDSTGQLTGYLGAARDITERKRADEAQRASEEHFRLMFESASVSLWDEDFSEIRAFADQLRAAGVADIGRYLEERPELVERLPSLIRLLDVNTETLRLFEAQSKAELFDSFAESVLPETLDFFRRQFIDYFEGQLRFQGETRVKTLTGKTRVVLVNAVFPPREAADQRLVASLLDITERQQAAAVLAESEARLRTVLENMPVLLDAFDAAGNIVAWNQECERVTGYTRAEIIGNPNAMARLYPDPAYLVEVMTAVSRLPAGYRNQEFTLTTKAGQPRIIRWSNISPEAPVPGWASWGVGVDVTERRRAEAALKQSETRYRLVSEMSSDFSFAFHLNPDGTIRPDWFTDSWTTVTGHPLNLTSDMAGLDQVVHPDDLALAREQMTQVLAGRDRHYEMRIVTPTGEVRWLEVRMRPWRDEAGAVIGVYGASQDVTERKLAEAALRESEARYRLVSEMVSDYAYSVRLGPDGYIEPVWVTEAWQAVTGYPPEAGRTLEGWRRVVHPEDFPLVREQTQRVLAGENTHYEIRIVTPAGEVRWLEVQAQPWRDEAGRVIGFNGASRNITERKLAEAALRASESRFRRLIERSWDIVQMISLEGVILYANEAVTRILGYELAEYIGTLASDYSHPDEMAAAAASLEQALAAPGQSFQVIGRARRKDGAYAWIEGALTNRLEDPDVGAIVLNMRDITERKQAEAALSASETRYRVISEMTSDFAYASRFGPDGIPRAEWVTDAWTTVTGYPLEVATNEKKWRQMIHPDDLALALEHIRRMLSSQDTQYEIRILTPTGEVRWLETRLRSWRDESGKVIGIYGASRNVTERKQAEERLAQLASILEATPDFVGISDLEGRVIYLNPAGRSLSGLSAEVDLSTFRIADFHPEPVAQRIFETGIPAALRDGLWVGETALRQPDGREIPVSQVILAQRDSSGQPRYLATIMRDLSERLRAETLLRQSETWFRALFEQAPVGVALSRDSRTTLANAAYAALFGYAKPQDVVGRPILEMVAPESHAAVSNFVASLSAAPMALEDDFTGQRADGSRFLFHIKATQLPLPTGSALIGFFFDITERKQMEAQLRSLSAELEKRVAERTAQLQVANQELESFAYSVSHDLRAPLRAIDGFSQALLEDYGLKLDTEGRDALLRVRRATQQMGQLIDDLLSLSRVTRHEILREPVDLTALADDVAATLAASATDRQVDFVIAPKLTVHADSRLMRILLTNLLSNAWKFTRQRARARIEVGVSESGAETVYFVRDNGAGFDMTYGSKLFKAFQRLHSTREFEGTGIGLATVARIVQRHGGRVWAEGVPQQGATVYFTLP